MKQKTLSIRLNTFDTETLQYICDKYKVSEADAVRKGIELLKEWDRQNIDKESAEMKILTNVEIAKIVLEELEKDDRYQNYTYEKILDDLDISRADETTKVNLDQIITNFKCFYEKQ